MTCTNGFCSGGSCICGSGFINSENICYEKCVLKPCQELIQNLSVSYPTKNHDSILLDISIKNMGINTENCSDMNGTQEFSCQCTAGFEGKRCELGRSFNRS